MKLSEHDKAAIEQFERFLKVAHFRHAELGETFPRSSCEAYCAIYDDDPELKEALARQEPR